MQRVEDAVRQIKCNITITDSCAAIIIYDVPKSLNERDKQRWWVKMEDKAIWLGVVQKALSECQCVFSGPINKDFMCTANWKQWRVHPLDYDNSIAGIKHIQDACVDAGILAADDWKHILKLNPARDVKVSHYSDQKCELIYTPTDVPVIA